MTPRSRPAGGSRPLEGRRILILRSRRQGEALAQRLRSLGAEPLLLPMLQIRCRPLAAEEREPLTRLGAGDWIAFTSPNGVHCLAEAGGLLTEAAGRGCRLAAVGPGTARAAEEHGLSVDLVSDRAEGPALALQMRRVLRPGGRVLFAAGSLAPERFSCILQEAGFRVERINVYETLPDPDGASRARTFLEQQRPDAVAFTSASTARFFLDALGPDGPMRLRRSGTRLVCIGVPTASVLESAGLIPSTAAEPGLEGLLRCLVESLQA